MKKIMIKKLVMLIKKKQKFWKELIGLQELEKQGMKKGNHLKKLKLSR
jgi:hypothetical protein